MPCDETLVPSNHERNGRVYLLNAEPGEYRPVAAALETFVYFVIGTGRGVDIIYLPDSLVRESSVQVQAGQLSDAGQHLVHASFGVCPDTADPGQLRYAEIIDPGIRKCGLVASALDSLLHMHRALRSRVVIGGKAYPFGTSVTHYRGMSYETLPGASSASILEEVRKDLEALGWHFDVRR